MLDPKHVERTLGLLRDAWEGQPSLSLAQLLGKLGVVLSDATLVDALERQIHAHPPVLPLKAGRVSEGRWLLATEGFRVTLTAEIVIVRPTAGARSTPRARRVGPGGEGLGQPEQPTIWGYDKVAGTGPGWPLSIVDAEGRRRRYGVVEELSRQRLDVPDLQGRTRSRMGDAVYVIKTEAETITVDHGLHVYKQERRTLSRADYKWDKVVECGVGKQLCLLAGGRQLRFGEVSEIHLAEDPVA